MVYLSTMKYPFTSKILQPLWVQWCGNTRFSSVADLFNERLTIQLKHKIEDKYKALVNGTKTYTREQNKATDQSANTGVHKKDNFYVLSMFPYPSGSLHMGHVRVYTISDTLARFYSFKGKKVFQPMGWDAFGLPAENAAIENKVDPHAWTLANISTMRGQLNSFGAQFDWDAELATCDPRYYKWTQALFLDLYAAGLVYRKEALVNWDPVDNTVLADEQVDENGISWRSGAQVEKRCLSQWFIRTTRLAKDLYEGLSDPVLQDWKDVINLQQHWIGEPNGVTFDFQVLPKEKDSKHSSERVSVTTLNVWLPQDEIESVVRSQGQFLAVKSSHLLVKNANSSSIIGHVHNPFTNSSIPIVVSDDLEYAPWRDIRLCSSESSQEKTEVARSSGILESIQNPIVEDQSVESWTQDRICSFALEKGIGGYPVSSKLRDWLISRQRYWGTPIPMIHCPSCGTLPLPHDRLPITLPPSPPAPLASNEAWQKTSCHQCGQEARRETDTMDTFVDSSWYYVRYLDKNNTQSAVNTSEANKWLPVDLYIGGKEHAVLHLYYARFIAHFLYAQGRTPSREPFKRMLVQGMIMGQTHREATTGKYLKPDEVYSKDATTKPGQKAGTVYSSLTHDPVIVSWEKMSKSKHNGVNPASLIAEYGVDTTRLFVLSDVAPTSEKHWSDSAFPGILNWQVKLWLLFHEYLKYKRSPDLVRAPLTPDQLAVAEGKLRDDRNKTVRSVSYAYDRNQQLNAAICRLQSFTASLRNVTPSMMASSSLYSSYVQELLIMLAPMCPHLCSFLWDVAEFSGPGLWDRPWPQVDQYYSLTFRVLILKKPILDLHMPKTELVKLDKSSAIRLLVEQIKRNKKMNLYQYLLEDTTLCESNEHIQLSIDPNNDAILTLPFSMKYVKPEEKSLEDEVSSDSNSNQTLAQR